MVVKIKTGKIYGLQPPLVATPLPPIYQHSRGVLFSFFWSHGLRPFVKHPNYIPCYSRVTVFLIHS